MGQQPSTSEVFVDETPTTSSPTQQSKEENDTSVSREQHVSLHPPGHRRSKADFAISQSSASKGSKGSRLQKKQGKVQRHHQEEQYYQQARHHHPKRNVSESPPYHTPHKRNPHGPLVGKHPPMGSSVHPDFSHPPHPLTSNNNYQNYQPRAVHAVPMSQFPGPQYSHQHPPNTASQPQQVHILYPTSAASTPSIPHHQQYYSYAQQTPANVWAHQWDADVDSLGEEDKSGKVPHHVPPVYNYNFRSGMDPPHSSVGSTPNVKRPVVVDDLRHVVEDTVSNVDERDSGDGEEESINEQISLKKMANQMLQKVLWDTSEASSAPDGTVHIVKPNVEMFLPLLRVLGKGSFGKVVLVRKRTGKECGGLFAMKILRKGHLVKRRQIERTRTERKVLSVVDHPFIMKLHFAFQTDDKLFLVLDYCPGGELFFHLSRYKRFPERVARFYAAELLLAIGHLHRKGIIYRDLKPENVLLDAEGHVKLGDFGLAKDNIKKPTEGATSMCGTPEYMAPEVLCQSGHGFCVDYWGLGMLIYEMMTGLPPWYTTDRLLLFKRIKRAPLEVPTFFSQPTTSVVRNLLSRDPKLRLGFNGNKSVMDHSFFKEVKFKLLYYKREQALIRPCDGWKELNSNNNISSSLHTTKQIPNSNAPSTSHHDINHHQSSSSNNLHMDNPEIIDRITLNFDKDFTRLPINTEDNTDIEKQYSGSADGSEELHSDTFVGFTYDDAVKVKVAAKGRSKNSKRTVP